MIPYFPPPVLRIGPLTVHGFGAAAAAALVVGHVLVRRRARVSGLDPDRTARIYLYFVVAGLVGGHLASLRSGQSGPLDVLAFWREQSAWGVGAGLAFAVLLLLVRQRRHAFAYAQVMALAFPWVWGIVRFGCFLAHDHVGARSSHWLAVAFPGGSRFDLGLLECLAALFACAVTALWRGRPAQGVLAILLVFYAAVVHFTVVTVAGEVTS